MQSRVHPSLLTGAFLVLVTALVAVLLPASAPATSASPPPVPRYGAHNDVSTPFNVTHLPTLARTRFDGGDLRFERVLRETLGHRRHQISYRSAGRRVSGVLLEPLVAGPRPVVVLAHGYTHPAAYKVGGQLEREQASLADAGYVVLQPDYRNHAESGHEGTRTRARPRGYAEDLINAVRALRLARLPYADIGRLGLLGRSMGGGVVLNALAAKPDLASAVVLYSPLNPSMPENFQRFVVRRGHHELRDRVVEAYGTARTRPKFWRAISSRSYLGRVAVPVQIHHGSADPVCPVRWSARTARDLRRAKLFTYAGEGHRFDDAWPLFMRRTRTFFDRNL